MPRSEFTKATKRQALERSGGRCEAVGAVYGLNPGQRCNSDFARGKEFDHYPKRAADGGDNSLENCMCVCTQCHAFKTRTFDTPMAAKGKRVSDKHLGISTTTSRIQSAGFAKADPQKSASSKLDKWFGWAPQEKSDDRH